MRNRIDISLKQKQPYAILHKAVYQNQNNYINI